MATACAQPQNLIHLDSPEVMNQVYYPFLFNQSRFLVMCGGAGSGKSIFAAQKIILRCMHSPGHLILVLRKVGRTIRNSCFRALLAVIRWFGVERWWHPNKSELSLTYCKGTPQESEIICAGLDDPEKIKSLEGVTSIWEEEPTEITRDAFIQANLRLRGQKNAPPEHYRQHILTFNPISEFHWLRYDFFSDPAWPEDDYTTMNTTVDDNLLVDSAYRASLDALKNVDVNLHKIYRLGLWGSLKGLIFETPWPEAEFPVDVPHGKVTYGVDFGYNDPMVVGRDFVHDQIHIFDEMLYERGMTTSDLIEWFGENGVHKDSEMYCDNAEPDRIEEICRAGYNAFPCKKGAGSVKAGISMLQGLKARGQGFLTPRSDNAKKEQSAWKWMENKAGELLDQPVDAFNHFWDQARYIVFTKFHELASGIC